MTRKRLSWENSVDRKCLVDALQKNEIAITSTDTVYGLLGNVSAESYNRICALKTSPTPRPFLILIASPTRSSLAETLSRFIEVENISNRMIKFLSSCWPGPLTVIFKAKPGLSDFLISSQGTIALRCPDHAGLQKILPEFDGLFSTSANKSGQPVPEQFSDISPELLEQVDYVVIDEAWEVVAKRKPSSIIDLSDNKVLWRVVRQGAYSLEKLKEIYGQTK